MNWLKIENCEFNGKKWEFFLSVNWIYHTDEEYFLLKCFENNHKCVPFGLLITILTWPHSFPLLKKQNYFFVLSHY